MDSKLPVSSFGFPVSRERNNTPNTDAAQDMPHYCVHTFKSEGLGGTGNQVPWMENRRRTANILLMRKQESCRKGQIWSLDFISGITLMSFLMLLFILEWNYLSLRWNTSSEYREMFSAAIFASEALFTTPGDPAGWERLGTINESVIQSFGLVGKRNEIDNNKLAKLASLNSSNANYTLVVEKLGLAGYQMHLQITDLEGNITYHDFGRVSGLNNSAVLERFVLLNGTTVGKARVEVWK